MTVIRALEVRLSSEGWGSTNKLPSLTINLKPTSSGHDIKSINYVYADKSGPRCGHLNVDLIESIDTQFHVRTNQQVWNQCLSDNFSLIHKFDSILTELSDKEVHYMASPYCTIFNNTVTTGFIDYNQRLVDVFLASTSIYLVIMQLIYDNVIWDAFPFYFNPPYDTFDGRSLTYYAIKYMIIPLDTMKVIGGTFSHEISWIISAFCNSWANDFNLGDKIDTSPILYQVVNQVLTSFTRSVAVERDQMRVIIANYQREMLGKIAEVTNSVIDLTARVDNLCASPEPVSVNPTPDTDSVNLVPVSVNPTPDTDSEPEYSPVPDSVNTVPVSVNTVYTNTEPASNRLTLAQIQDELTVD